MAENKQGTVAIPAKTIVRRIDEKSGPKGPTGSMVRKGYGTMSTQKPGKPNL